jgi:DNA topoisomerase-3
MRSDGIVSNGGSLKVACPKCGGNLRESHRRIQCHSCDFALWTIMASRQFTTSELEELISTRRIGPFQDFRNKTGERFAAAIKLTPTLEVEFELRH